MAQEIRIGRHLVQIEGDVVFTRQSGQIAMSELQEMLEIWNRFLLEHPRGYALYDVTDGVPLGLAERKCLNEWSKQNVFAGAAFFGASLLIRTITTLVMRASALLRPGRAQPSIFCKSEQEARQWIDEQRRGS